MFASDTSTKISIVVTTCNRLAFLKRSVESALNQTQPCEIVVVDDDYFHPDCIQRLSKIINQYQDLVICSGQAAYIDVKGNKIKTTRKFGTGQGVYIQK